MTAQKSRFFLCPDQPVAIIFTSPEFLLLHIFRLIAFYIRLENPLSQSFHPHPWLYCFIGSIPIQNQIRQKYKNPSLPFQYIYIYIYRKPLRYLLLFWMKMYLYWSYLNRNTRFKIPCDPLFIRIRVCFLPLAQKQVIYLKYVSPI